MKKSTKSKILTITASLAIAFYAGREVYTDNPLDYLIDIATFAGKIIFIFDNAFSKKEDFLKNNDN